MSVYHVLMLVVMLCIVFKGFGWRPKGRLHAVYVPEEPLECFRMMSRKPCLLALPFAHALTEVPIRLCHCVFVCEVAAWPLLPCRSGMQLALLVSHRVLAAFACAPDCFLLLESALDRLHPRSSVCAEKLFEFPSFVIAQRH